MRPRTKKRPSGNRLQEGHIYIEAYEQHLRRFLRGMKYDTKPATCKWLSDETYVLPPVVNIVYTMTFESERFKAPLDLVRFAQFMPNTKYRPPNFAAITIRLWPTTALLYMVGKMTLIRATTRSQALFFSHLNRQIIEQVPILMKNMDDPEGKPYIGTLEGYLDCSIGEVQNMVGSGVLPQNGVHLTRLLYSKDEAVDWDPGGFPNLIYRDYLSDGTLFCANIAITGKIVLMGLKTVEGLYESYKMMCKVLHDFDDPNAPSDPKERHKYRMRQLEQDPRFLKETEAKPEEHADYVENIGVERGDAGVEALGGDIDDGDQVVRMFTDDFANKEIGPRLRIKIEEGGRDVVNENLPTTGDEEHPLFIAARRGQHANVRYILSMPGSEMSDAVWLRNPQTNELLIRELLEPLMAPEHLQVSHLIEEYIAKNKKTT